MTDDPKQEQKKSIPVKGKAKKPKVKRVRKIGVFSILFLFILIITLITLTPTYSIILNLLPEQYTQAILQDIHQTITLDKTGKEISEPFKYNAVNPLPVLGFNTGVCFSFAHKSGVDTSNNKALKRAAQNQEIAEIIVVGNNKYEYNLKTVTIEEINDLNDKRTSNICQMFGRDYPVTPRHINIIYVRPIESFTPTEILWATTRDIPQN